MAHVVLGVVRVEWIVFGVVGGFFAIFLVLLPLVLFFTAMVVLQRDFCSKSGRAMAELPVGRGFVHGGLMRHGCQDH